MAPVAHQPEQEIPGNDGPVHHLLGPDKALNDKVVLSLSGIDAGVETTGPPFSTPLFLSELCIVCQGGKPDKHCRSCNEAFHAECCTSPLCSLNHHTKQSENANDMATICESQFSEYRNGAVFLIHSPQNDFQAVGRWSWCPELGRRMPYGIQHIKDKLNNGSEGDVYNVFGMGGQLGQFKHLKSALRKVHYKSLKRFCGVNEDPEEHLGGAIRLLSLDDVRKLPQSKERALLNDCICGQLLCNSIGYDRKRHLKQKGTSSEYVDYCQSADDARNILQAVRKLASSNFVFSSLGLCLRILRSQIAGWGVYVDFAKPSVPHNAFIPPLSPLCEYTGELISNSEADSREAFYLAHPAKYSGNYMFRLDADTVVDGRRVGSLARYINHSCQPNCIAFTISSSSSSYSNSRKKPKNGNVKPSSSPVDSNSKGIVIFAREALLPGQELTIDYGFEDDDGDPSASIASAKVECRCGAAKCRKWL